MRRWVMGGLAAAWMAGAAAMVGQAAGSAEERCARLASLKLEQATVDLAAMAGGGVGVEGTKLAEAKVKALPGFCRVRVTDRPTSDSEIKVEVWLPVEGWTGRYRGHGNGGFAGDVGYERMSSSVMDGDATSGTDAGHPGTDGSFALGHPEKVKDFGWRAVHEMAVESKAIVGAFYGRAAGHAYFTACSDGGREALMEAERFPGDFDGILAGAPAYNWTALVSSGTVTTQALMAKPGSYVAGRKMAAVAGAVRLACDAKDGVADGVLNDPRECRFDPAVLACKGAETDACLMPEQVATLRTIYAPKVDEKGRAIYPGYSPGAEDAAGGLVGWQVAAKPGDDTALMFFGEGFFKNFVYPEGGWTVAGFELGKDYRRATEVTGEALNATDTNLRPFLARGGKLVMYHGWNDPAIPALGTIAYWDGVVKTVGRKEVDAGVRLYMVPGMLHCDGGPGATVFGEEPGGARGDAKHDVVTAMEEWVEKKLAPGELIAVKFVGDDAGKGVAMSRPLCVYPAVARYVAGKDDKSAEGFVCEVKGR